MRKIMNFMMMLVMMLVMCNFFVVKTEMVIEANDDNIIACADGLDFTASGHENDTGCTKDTFLLKDSNGEPLKDNMDRPITISGVGELYISRNGVIKVTFKYGVSEVLVLAEGGKTGKMIIHASGKKVSNTNVPESREIHLYKYFKEGEVVTYELIFQLAEQSDYNALESDKNSFFYPIYCNPDNNNCGANDSDQPIKNLLRGVSYRISKYATKIGITSIDEKIEFSDRSQLVYQGRKNTLTTDIVTIAKENYNIQYDKNVVIADITVKIGNTSFEESKGEVDDIINNTVIPTLLWILGIGAVVTGTVLGWQIVKSADEPQERAEKISRLKSILIGIIIAFILLMAIGPMKDFIMRYIE